MERIDSAAMFREKTGSSNKTAKRALGANNWDMEKEKKMRNGFENNPALRALSHLSGWILPSRFSRTCRCGGRPCTCGSPVGSLAREEGSTPNNPYAMYTPGWYNRGC